ncbi:MAG: hypothetical protein ACJ74J_03125 [Blastocatellia bacterium]
MAIRILIIFAPVLIGFLWQDAPGPSLAWSFTSSVVIACIAQTNWFRQSGVKEAFTRHLMRPAFMFHFIFVAYNVLGGAAYALNASGYTLGSNLIPMTVDLSVLAECQRLMLLAHASVAAGMKLLGFHYKDPKYVIPSIPPYSLVIASFVGLGVGTFVSAIQFSGQMGQKILAVAMAAILVDIAVCIRQRRYYNLTLALAILALNLYQQSVSGWKGNILWTMIFLGALLFPLMPKVVTLGGSAFVVFWALYFYPFGLALRPLIWYEGVQQDTAVQMSMDRALNMSLNERLDTVWEMMVGRANELDQFTKYVEYVPAHHSYYQFDILSDATTALIPRMIWQNKPDLEIISMQRVYEAGIVARQTEVSAKSNFYQDAYLSGGEGAIILGCLLLGMLMILLSRTCEWLFGGYDIGTCIIYMGFLGVTIAQPSNFEYFFAAIGMSVFLMFAIFALGRTTGWIVPASKLARMPEKPTAEALSAKKETPARFKPNLRFSPSPQVKKLTDTQ